MAKTNQQLLDKICEEEGVDEMELLEEAVFDSVVPAICKNCEMVNEMEPDQERGYCDNCGKNEVVSCLILAGLI